MRSSCLFSLSLLAASLPAQTLAEFEKKVTEFTLANGLHFILVERHEAPVASFHTYVKAGSIDDPAGQTGLAHMFEHMAFKGTPAIGTKDWTKEKQALDDVEQAYSRLEAERRKDLAADKGKIDDLEARLKAAIENANRYVVPNEYPRIIEENGGVGLNAGTGLESTSYYYNFPSNRAELWFLLESQRFLTPVFREFYKERDVVREERRQRVESDPQGKLAEAALATAFAAHPYRQMPGGWASDIENLRLSSAEAFYKTYYVPGNMIISIVGDIQPAEARRLAEKYFGRLPAGPLPPLVSTVEPKQEGPKRVSVETPSQPILLVAYKRPEETHKDDAVFDVISSILSGGRTGIIYKELVRDRRVALAAGTQPSFPGSKYPNLFLFYSVPSQGQTAEGNEKELYDILEKFKTQKVDAATLKRVKTKARADVIRQLDSNAGLAAQLPRYYAAYGNWRKLFQELEEMDKVTADDVQRVAREYFVESGRTVALMTPPPKPARPAGGAR